MIGIFDSGYGGLTIFKEIEKLLPEYDYIYFGDNARAPYGPHGKETVTRFSREAVDFLSSKGCKLIIFACYTASAMALREIQKEYLSQGKILGVVRPVVEYAASHSKARNVGVVGTRGTIDSGAFETELKHLNPKIKVVSQACPLLVPFIEEHWHTKPEARMILRKYLQPLKHAHVDTLILGCTHYPLLSKDFKRMMGRNVEVFNTGKIVAQSLQDYLKRHPELKLAKNGGRAFYTSDDPEKFKIFGKRFAGVEMPRVEKA